MTKDEGYNPTNATLNVTIGDNRLAVLAFSLPEQEAEFRLALDAGRLISALDELRRSLQARHKHGEYETAEAIHLIDGIYTEFHDIITEVGIGEHL